MNILYDHQIFSLQTYGGISRYFSELIYGINTTTLHNAQLSLQCTNNSYAHDLNLTNYYFLKNSIFPKKMSLLYGINKVKSSYDLSKKSYDVVHATYYDPYLIPLIKDRPLVVTFLDMIHEKLGPQFKRELVYDGKITKQKQLIANRADRIIAISESTKRDIIDILDVDPEKIDVIYLGNSLVPDPNRFSESVNPNPYILFVGNRGIYKNFSGLLEAIYPILKKHKINLICAGGGAFDKNEKTLIYSLKVNEYVEQRIINDQLLQDLYQGALAFVFPTLYEGFGIPVLEAFACGCACIISNVSSLPEVAGDAALYIDPTVAESMHDAVESLINDVSLRNHLIKKGYERLSKFSWANTIKSTIGVYARVI